MNTDTMRQPLFTIILLVAWLQRSTASAEIAQIFAALLLRVFGHQLQMGTLTGPGAEL